MQTLKPQDLISPLQWRYAVKLFDVNRKIAPETWTALETALQLTPSSYGLQPWKFLVIENSSLREQLKAASWNQRQVTDCSHFVVMLQMRELTEAHVDHYMNTIAQVRGVPVAQLEGFRKVIIGDAIKGPRAKWAHEWLARQCYIALGNFMTSAALLGVDACPMEGLDSVKYDEILGLNNTAFQTVVACAVGYRSQEDFLASAKKVRFPLSEIIEHR